MPGLTLETVGAVFARAMDAGARPEVRDDGLAYRRVITWRVAGGCEQPVPVELWSRYHVSTKQGKPMTVILQTPCRRCGWCLMHRRHRWADRAIEEFKQSVRTWFVTLTFRPEVLYERECELRRHVLPVGEYDSLTPDKRFGELVRLCGSRHHEDGRFFGGDLALFLKRVRKNSGAPMRYLAVAEAHKSGMPHFHLLIHEQDAARPIRKVVLKEAWDVGFSAVKLCSDSRAAVYLCKYLAKEARTRVRASFRYGKRRVFYCTQSLHSVAWETRPSEVLDRPETDSSGSNHGYGSISDPDRSGEAAGASTAVSERELLAVADEFSQQDL